MRFFKVINDTMHLTGITELVLIFFTNEYKNDHDKKVTSVLRRSDRKLFGGKFMH